MRRRGDLRGKAERREQEGFKSEEGRMVPWWSAAYIFVLGSVSLASKDGEDTQKARLAPIRIRFAVGALGHLPVVWICRRLLWRRRGQLLELVIKRMQGEKAAGLALGRKQRGSHQTEQALGEGALPHFALGEGPELRQQGGEKVAESAFLERLLRHPFFGDGGQSRESRCE